MKKISNLNNIANLYNLKVIFSYLDYGLILKIIKNNKELQNKLGINLEDYIKESNNLKYEFNRNIETYSKRTGVFDPKFPQFVKIFCLSFNSCILCIYAIIYAILLACLDLFDGSNLKFDYNKNYLDNIKIINNCLFIYIGLIIISCLFFIFFVKKGLNHEFGFKKIIKLAIIIFINLIYLIFEILIIYKLVLSYKIKSEEINAPWFMVMDYIFIFLNFFDLLYLFIISFVYCSGKYDNYRTEINYFLTSFNYIKINNYMLPDNFNDFSKNDRKKYIKENYENFEYKYSKEQIELIRSLNKFREDKNIEIFKIGKKLPKFILKESSEIMLYKDKNFFKISDRKYLFKYPVNEFEKKFNNRDNNIINVLLKENLNHIQIITKDNIEYVIISELDLFNYNCYNINSLNEEEESFKKKGKHRIIDSDSKIYIE